MTMKLKAIAYSSSANLGPGYDVLAMAIDLFYDEVIVEIKKSSTTRIETVNVSGPYSSYVPISENTATAAAKEFLKRYNIEAEIKLKIVKNVPVGRGLGSSGATAAATVAALAKAFNISNVNELVEIAAEGEKAAAGAPHPDNVAASLLGGIVLIYSRRPLKVVKIPLKTKPKIIIVSPEPSIIKDKTKYARSLVPKMIPLENVVLNTGRIAALITGFITGNLKLAGEGMEDSIVEPARKPILPLYFEVKEKLKNMGALGVCVSGAGPSILVMFEPNVSKQTLEKIKEYIVEECSRREIKTHIYEASIADGAKVEIIEG
ncbi:MAG: homoserine kinase [Desulfurococcales archaeon ex4484_217_2]|nr:MAG: homoserine kinase [Desulfurococcales archaeon ex4484_217_2]